MNIKNSTHEDMDEIFRLYKIATDYQKAKFSGNVWPDFERAMIQKEVEEQHQWKLCIDGQIACIWATTFSDPQIWEDRNIDPAIYIYRIATNPDCRGQNFVDKIVQWAKAYAAQHHKNYIRLDTCGDNQSLIQHYQKCGFNFLGMWKIKSAAGLPAHYENAEVCFFEIALNE